MQLQLRYYSSTVAEPPEPQDSSSSTLTVMLCQSQSRFASRYSAIQCLQCAHAWNQSPWQRHQTTPKYVLGRHPLAGVPNDA
jgi:hypothetical protein